MSSYKHSRTPIRWAGALVLLLCVSANVFAAPKNSGTLAINPTGIAFGSLTVSTSLTQNVVILNTGTGNVTVSTATMSGAGFSATGLTLPMTLAPGQSAAFQAKFSPLSAGSVTGSVSIKKSNGTVLASVSLTGTGLAVALSDTTSPTVSVTGPANGATISGNVALTASASDNVGVVGVQYFVNGTAIGSVVTTAPYSVSWNTTAVSNGSGYLITARAGDAAENQATSTAVTTAVSNVTVQHSASLSWAASPSSIIGYYVYRATQVGGPFNRINTTPDPSTLFTDGSVSGGQVYYYVVTAVDANQVESAYSNESTASIPL